jgi:hypothetical protein
MRKVPWSDLTIDSSTAHLVAGIVADDNTPRLLIQIIASLMKHLELKGEYALAVNRGMGTTEIHCAFRQQADADLFAESVEAVASNNYPGWLSQRAFSLHDAAVERIKRTRDNLIRAKRMRPLQRSGMAPR